MTERQDIPAGDFSAWLGRMRHVLSAAGGIGVDCGDCDGCCPMLIDGGCSIYEHRPLTCRIYDSRVFAAAGIVAGGDDRKKNQSAREALEVQLSHKSRPR
ncbi:MAG: hypothetical protein WC828_03075 [Thermoleophilia bacterium]|jgi:hypothetical protein